MSEKTPHYSSPAAGEVRNPPAMREVLQGLMPSFVPGAQPPCHHCGCAVHSLTIHDAPALECLAYLRSEIGTLQGEVLALRLQLAARPEPCITTYEQLSALTGIPVARLESLRYFAPEAEAVAPEGCVCCGQRDATVWRAPDDMYRNVTGYEHGEGVLCMECFEALAFHHGVTLYWECANGHFPLGPEAEETLHGS